MITDLGWLPLVGPGSVGARMVSKAQAQQDQVCGGLVDAHQLGTGMNEGFFFGLDVSAYRLNLE